MEVRCRQLSSAADSILQLQTAVSPPELLELEAQTTGSQMSPSMMFERAEHEVPTAVELRSLAPPWAGGVGMRKEEAAETEVVVGR